MPEPNFSEKGYAVRREVRTEGGIVGIGGKRHEIVQFENGEIWDFPDGEEPKFVNTDRPSAARWDAARKAEAAKDAASAWTLEGRDDGTYRVNKVTGASEKVQGLPAKTQTAPNPSFAPAGQTDPTDRYISMYDPITGELKQVGNPNYDPEQTRLKSLLLEAQIAAQNRSGIREPTGQLTDYQRWQIGNYPQEEGEKRRQFDLQEMRARLDREAQDRRNQLTNQATLFGQMSGARERNLEWQLPQDAKYLPLMEPGGVMSRLLPGVKPMEVVRVPWDQISGEEIWKRTRGMTGG